MKTEIRSVANTIRGRDNKYSYCLERLFILIFLISGMLTSCFQTKTKSVDSTADPLSIKIPVVSGPLTIDGKPDDLLWQSALSVSLTNKDNSIFGQGGEARIAVRGKYLCLVSRIPENGRVTARSTGVNPAWWREDMIIWMIRYQSPFTLKNTVALFAVNPFGAFSLGSVKDIYNITKNDLLTPTPIEWSNDILVAAEITNNEWIMEAAIPLEKLGKLGFISLERVRVPRVSTPELRWYWPAQNEMVSFELTDSSYEPTPLFKRPGLPNNSKDTSYLIAINSLASEVSALPKQAWTSEEQESLGVRKKLEVSIRRHMATSVESEKRAWQEVKTVGDWEKFREKRINSLLKSIGPLPEHTPLKSKITRRIDNGEGFIIENILFESRPNLVVAANLYLPAKPRGKIPVIIVVHSQHAPKTQAELQDMGMTWAKAGTAVLIMDQLCSGERIQTQPWPREGYYGRYALGNQLYLAGESLIKWMAWDIIRGIDLVTERDYIDQKRIVLLGAVAGGGDPAALAANLDKRIAVVIPFNFGEAGPEEHYTEGPRWYDFESADPGWAFWETTRNLPRNVADQFFPWFICAAVAPRNFIYSFELGWPTSVEDEPAWSRYKKVYELYNKKDHLASVDGFGPFPGPGECTNVGTFLRKRIYPILNSWLDIQVPESEYHKALPELELMCLTPSSATDYLPKPASLLSLELVRQRFTEYEKQISGLSSDERASYMRQALKQKLGDIEPLNSPTVINLWSRKCSGFSMEAFSIETETGITIPVFMLIPENGSIRHPVVIALAEGGKEGFLTKRINEIAVLLSNGITVCLPDVRGNGELASSNTRSPGAMSLAANELMLGRTLIGSRLKDTRTLFSWLSKRTDIDPKNIALWGDSFSEPNCPDFKYDQSPGQQTGPVLQRQSEPLGPFLAILTALYENNICAIACKRGLISFSSALEDNFCQIPQDVIVPGILEVTDIRVMISLIAPRPILLTEMINGLNKKVSLSMMEKEYDSHLPNLTLNEDSENQLLAIWLTQHVLRKSE